MKLNMSFNRNVVLSKSTIYVNNKHICNNICNKNFVSKNNMSTDPNQIMFVDWQT